MNDWLDIFTQTAARELGNGGSNWLLDWMTDGQADAVIKQGGRSIARYGWRPKAVAAVCTMFFTVMTIVGLSMPGPDKWIAAPFAVMLAVAAMLLLMLCVGRIAFDRTDLRVRRLFRRNLTIPWSEVRAVGYSDFSGYVIEAGIAGRVNVGIAMSGCMVVVHMARAMARQNRATDVNADA